MNSINIKKILKIFFLVILIVFAYTEYVVIPENLQYLEKKYQTIPHEYDTRIYDILEQMSI